jgi:hypothetical protein
MSADLLAQRFFDCHMQHTILESELDDAVLACFGANPQDVETWPCGHLVYDEYDGSFELWRCKDDWAPTAAQYAAVKALGFTQGWFCYADGTERYAMGPRLLKSASRDSDKKQTIRKLQQQLAASEAAHQQAEQDRDDYKRHVESRDSQLAVVLDAVKHPSPRNGQHPSLNEYRERVAELLNAEAEFSDLRAQVDRVCQSEATMRGLLGQALDKLRKLEGV